MSWLQVPVPSVVYDQLTELGGRRIRAFQRDSIRCLVTIDNGLWHISISAPDRYPTWDEIADARYDLCPDEITMAMFLPPKSEYVNLHPTTFHLHEVSDDAQPAHLQVVPSAPPGGMGRTHE